MTLAYGSPNRTRRTPRSIPRVWAIRLAALHRPIVISTARESWRLEARQVGRVGFRGRDSSDVIISAKRSINSDRSWPRTADSRIGLSAGARLPFQVIEVEDDRGVLDRRLLPDEVAGVDDYEAADGQPLVEELGVDERDYSVVAAAFRPSFAPPNLPGQVPRHCRPGLTSERHGRDRKPRRDISATRRLGLKSTFPGRFGPPKALACPSGESYDRFGTA
jgi:hypothetical protein